MKIIVFAQPRKGGVTKTSNAINQAIQFMNSNNSLLFVDMDKSKQATSINKKRELNKLKVIPMATVDTASALATLLSNSNVDFIIVDTGGYDLDIQNLAMYYADILIIPCSSSSSDVEELEEFIPSVKKMIFSNDNNYTKVMILASKVHIRNKSFQKSLKDKFEKMDRINVFNTTIASLKCYEHMRKTGKSVFEMNTHTRAILDTNSLHSELVELCNG